MISPRTTGPLRPCLAVALALFLGALLPAGAQDTESSEPPEITAALAPLRNLETKAAAAKQTRVDQYLADLEALEKTVAKETGDLEQVIVVRKEKEAWAKGEPTDAIDPKDESKPLPLRKLRYYFDQELAKLEQQGATALAQAREQAVAKLQALEKQSTREKKIELAVAARKEREQMMKVTTPVPDDPKPAPGSPEFRPGIELPFINEDPGELRAWGKTKGGVAIESTLPDSGKFVQVAADHHSEKWGALDRSGDCLFTTDFSDSLDKMRQQTVRDTPGFHRSYLISALGEKTQSRQEGVMIHTVEHGDTKYTIFEDGRVEFSGKLLKDPSKQPPVEKLDGVVMACSGVSATVFVREDGSTFGWAAGDGEFAVPTDEEIIVYLDGGYSGIAGLSSSGRVFIWGKNPAAVETLASGIPSAEGPFTAVRIANQAVAARRRDGSWVAWGKNTGGVVDQINSLGTVKDLDFTTHPGSDSGWVIWIE